MNSFKEMFLLARMFPLAVIHRGSYVIETSPLISTVLGSLFALLTNMSYPAVQANKESFLSILVLSVCIII